jgi:hypothetical protein
MKRRMFRFNNDTGLSPTKLFGMGSSFYDDYALKQIRSIALVKECARKSKLKLRKFITDEQLEVYFDVYRRDKNICFLAKGWDDPGFRIGEIIKLDKNNPDFKRNFYRVFTVCSKELISLGIFKQDKDYLWLSLGIGIYYDGLNEKVFRVAAATLKSASDKIRAFLKPKTRDTFL